MSADYTPTNANSERGWKSISRRYDNDENVSNRIGAEEWEKKCPGGTSSGKLDAAFFKLCLQQKYIARPVSQSKKIERLDLW